MVEDDQVERFSLLPEAARSFVPEAARHQIRRELASSPELLEVTILLGAAGFRALALGLVGGLARRGGA